MTTLQIARSSFVKHRFRPQISADGCFSLGYRIAVAPGVLALVLLAFSLPLLPLSAVAQTPTVLHVAAAADLQPVLPTLAADYEKQTGIKIVPSFGSSATLTQQITSGDPQDVFLSADTAHPQQLMTAGLATNLTPYARGILILWARTDSVAQPLSMNVLTNDKVSRIAIANDLHAPYGSAATSALKSLGLYDKVKSKLVVGENISQTAQFALTGNAQVALISLTIASSRTYRDVGSFVPVPKVYPEIRQSGVVIAASRQQSAATAFLAWLTSSATQKRLPDFGLDPAK